MKHRNMKLILFTSLILLTSLTYAQTPRGRIQIKDGTLVTDSGTLLRGAYVSIDTPWDSLPPREYITKIKKLGLNCIHLYAEHPNYQNTGDNRNKIDSLVKWTKNDSLYLILTMSGWSSGYGNYDYVTNFWRFYASRYKDETHLIFEICNEPYLSDYPYIIPYDSLTLAMEKAAYDTIHFYAPETHVIFMSYPFTNSDYPVIQEIKNLGAGIDWNNASIGAHGYTLSSEENRAFIRTVKDSGYAITITESPCIRFYDSAPDLYVNLAFLRVFEKEFVSYVNFFSVRHMIDKPYIFKLKIESSEIRWSPDFGIWPENLTQINYASPYTTIMSGFYDEGADVPNYSGLTLWYIPDNAYVAFYNLDFESGADSIIIKCSSEYTNSKIQIRLDSLDGSLVGTCTLINTGRDNVKAFSYPITKVEGIHKIYMVFKGPASIFHSIKFKKAGTTSIGPLAKTDNQNICIFPNPTHSTFNITCAQMNYKSTKYILMDFTGKVIQQGNTADNSIDVSGIKKGIYILYLNINGKTINKKIVIE
jgi:hypothetical protein